MNLLRRVFGIQTTKKFKIGDRVFLKGRPYSEKQGHPDVWIINDIIKGFGYRIVKEGTCIITLRVLQDWNLEDASDLPRNDIDVFLNDKLPKIRSSVTRVNE